MKPSTLLISAAAVSALAIGIVVANCRQPNADNPRSVLMPLLGYFPRIDCFQKSRSPFSFMTP